MTYSRSDLDMNASKTGAHTRPTLAVLLIYMANVLTVWSHRRKSRRALGQLTAQHLDDLGLTRAQAEKESLKRFWMP